MLFQRQYRDPNKGVGQLRNFLKLTTQLTLTKLLAEQEATRKEQPYNKTKFPHWIKILKPFFLI